MQLNNVVGRSFPPVRFAPEDRLNVPAYARVLGVDDDPHWRSGRRARADGRAGKPVPVAMLGFFLAVDADTLVEELGFTWGRTLNASIDVLATRPVADTDEIEATATVDDAYEKVSHDGTVRQVLSLRADFAVDGELAARWRVTFLERKDGPRDPALPDAPRLQGDDRELAVATAKIAGPAAKLAAGDPLPTVGVGPFDRFDLARLSVALDNPDPLHLDDTVAQAAGFEQVIGHGSFIVGLLAEPARRVVALDRIVWAHTVQRAPYTIGDTLQASGFVRRVEVITDRRVAIVETQVVAGERLVATGELVVVAD